MSRRIRLDRAALVGALLCFAHLAPAGPAHAQPKPVVVIQSGEAATLDWHMHCDKNAHEPDRQIFDTLLRRNIKTLQLEGNLAESWRVVNDTTWQFKLKRGVKFHNGEPFDAAAVVWNFERWWKSSHPQHENQTKAGQTFETNVEGSVGVDEFTVIPAGSKIRGVISLATPATRQQSGVIEVVFDRLMLPNGSTFPITGKLTSTDSAERRQIQSDPNARVVLVGERGGIGAAIAGIFGART